MSHSEIMHGSFGDYTVYYDDGFNKVGTSEERSNGTTEFRNNDGDVTGHSEKGSDLVGHETIEYSDKYGAETGHSERSSDLVGHPTTEYYGDDGGRGTSERSSDLVGHPTTVYHGDIPGLSRESKESGSTASSDSSSSSSSSGSSYDSGSGQKSSSRGKSSGAKSTANPRTNSESITGTRNTLVPIETPSSRSNGGVGSFFGLLAVGFLAFLFMSWTSEEQSPKKKDDEPKDDADSDESKVLIRELDAAIEAQNVRIQKLRQENPDLPDPNRITVPNALNDPGAATRQRRTPIARMQPRHIEKLQGNQFFLWLFYGSISIAVGLIAYLANIIKF